MHVLLELVLVPRLELTSDMTCKVYRPYRPTDQARPEPLCRISPLRTTLFPEMGPRERSLAEPKARSLTRPFSCAPSSTHSLGGAVLYTADTGKC